MPFAYITVCSGALKKHCVDDGSEDEPDQNIQECDPLLEQDDGWIELMNSDSDVEDDKDHDCKLSKDLHPKSNPGAERAVYKELHTMGLLTWPSGCTVGAHLESQTWRTKTNTSPHFGRSWGGSTGRTERQALVRVLILMHESFLTSCGKCKSAEAKLSTLQLKNLRAEWDKDPGKL